MGHRYTSAWNLHSDMSVYSMYDLRSSLTAIYFGRSEYEMVKVFVTDTGKDINS